MSNTEENIIIEKAEHMKEKWNAPQLECLGAKVTANGGSAGSDAGFTSTSS